MRRQVLSISLNKIINDLNSCELPVIFRKIMDIMHRDRNDDTDGKSNFSFTLFQQYMLATNNYSDDEKHICKILGFEQLLTPDFWEAIAYKDINEGVMQMCFEMHRNIQFTMNQLPKILELTKQHYISEIVEEKGNLPEVLKGKTLLTVLISEDEGQFSNPQRLSNTLEAISNFYEAIAIIEGVNKNELIVLACDSGSDKSFDFLGLAKVMEQVKEIIFSIWDRKVFYRQHEVSQSLSLIAESLPIIEKVAEMERAKAIGKEQAEILKRQLIKGATQFLTAGVTIPELEAVSYHNPKQLMSPEQSLLCAPSYDITVRETTTVENAPIENTSDEHSVVDSENLDESEAKMLELLLKKSKLKPKDASGAKSKPKRRSTRVKKEPIEMEQP
ncbi:MAG: hypothetical protein HRU22_10505 [Gammaproteobacteria bacterium]|nr:hypothetical protein [Gammaproteobacteria bacterium]